MSYDQVLAALEEQGLLKGGWGQNKMALCPSHPDQRASLSVKEGDDGRTLLYCHAGCDTKDVIASLGLGMDDLFGADAGGSEGRFLVDRYVYTDEQGEPLYRVNRYSPKGFNQEHWDGTTWTLGLNGVRRVLYRLPEVLSSDVVYLVEGEKDADALASLGLVATTGLGGAGKWMDEWSTTLQGKSITVVADADEPGRRHAERVAQALQGFASSVRVVHPVVGKDVTDHLLAGYGMTDLCELEELVEFEPLDWQTYDTPDTEWLLHPWVPRGGRVLAYGAKGSLKSLWCMWLAAKVAQEGGKVAYFSLEMSAGQTAKRLKQLRPSPSLKCYTQFKMGDQWHTEQMLKHFNGYDLIVIDSWSAARPIRDGNEEVAELDRDLFLPLIEQTGATLLIIDNTGHPSLTNDGRVVQSDHARGASAKGDKMEMELWFSRPLENNNYRTRIQCKKMRLDQEWPDPVTVETPHDRIEFYEVRGMKMTDEPMWPGMKVDADATTPSVDAQLPVSGDDVGGGGGSTTFEPERQGSPTQAEAATPPSSLTLAEQLAFARAEDAFREMVKDD